jgi:hypothetical protein
LHKTGFLQSHTKEKKMNIVPTFTTLRSFASYQFSVLQMRARLDQVWAKLSGTNTELSVFPGSDPDLGRATSLKLLGLQDIRVDQIAGTLNRTRDFDHQFRPLTKHSLDRWVSTYLLHEQDRWAPLVIHKIRERYFVEDGHHRVSVARMIGMDFIDAKVWEHGIQSIQSKHADICPRAQCTEKSSTKVYATG